MQDLYDDVILWKRAGDALRLIATISLILMIYDSKKTAGVSGVSQLLYVIIYAARYCGSYIGDVIVINAFETVMRSTLMISSFVIVYLCYRKFKHNLSFIEDLFRVVYLVVPCALLAVVYNPGFSNSLFAYDEVLLFGFPYVEMFWALSYYLESVAILPQLQLLLSSQIREKQDFVSIYVMIMGLSRVFYTLYSIWERKHDVITDTTGAMQMCLFLWYFLLRIESNHKIDRNELTNVDE